MKKIAFLFFIIFSFPPLLIKAQLLLPQFNEAKKVEVFETTHEESTPIFFNDGKGIYFSRTYIRGKDQKQEVTGQDVFTSTFAGGMWKKPFRLFGPKTIEGENSLIGCNEDGSRIYLINTFIRNDSALRRIIYLDKTGEDSWSKPTTVNIPGLKFGEKYANLFITKNEKFMLISISPSKLNVNEDLHVSIKQEDGSWGELIDLGPTINTSRFEVYPFVSENGKNLYFSSNGHGGYGASDIFVSHRLDDSWKRWTKPLNLGEPINSEDYDASFFIANNTDVYFTSDRLSEHNNIYLSTTSGEFRYANSVQGLYLFKGKPLANKTLMVLDEEGNLVEEILTDEEGAFKFIKLHTEDNFMVKYDDEDTELFEGSKIYFVDAYGIKTKRYILTKDGMFVNSKDIEKVDEIAGVFNYNSLPSMKSGLVILDENGFPLDTIYTDENGQFSYSFLQYDNQYSISPLNMTEDDFANVDMYLVDEMGNKLQPIKPGVLHLIERKTPTVAKLVAVDNTKPAGIDLENVTGAGIEISAWNGMGIESRSVYFEFNSSELSQIEQSKLSSALSILKLDGERKVELVGHTDSKGPSELNMTIGRHRATKVKEYLVSNGISANRINVESKGESTPVASNETVEGRLKNRRVVVEIK